MSKLDLIIDRLRALPPEEQDVWAEEIELMIDAAESALTPEQWAEVDAALKEPDGELLRHAEVTAELTTKFG